MAHRVKLMLKVVLCLGLRHKRILIYNSITLYMPLISLKRKGAVKKRPTKRPINLASANLSVFF